MAYRKKSGGSRGGSRRGGVRRKSYGGKAGRSSRGGQSRGGVHTVRVVVEQVQPGADAAGLALNGVKTAPAKVSKF